MKSRLGSLVSVSLLALSGCGSGTGATYTLSSGMYRLSGLSAVQPDECNLGNDFEEGMAIQISVSGSNATFSLDPPPDLNQDPVAMIQGNTINDGSKSYDKDHADPPPGFDCVETITVTVGGKLTAQDQFQGTIVQRSMLKSGTQCTAIRLDYKMFPCSSRLNLTAKKI